MPVAVGHALTGVLARARGTAVDAGVEAARNERDLIAAGTTAVGTRRLGMARIGRPMVEALSCTSVGSSEGKKVDARLE